MWAKERKLHFGNSQIQTCDNYTRTHSKQTKTTADYDNRKQMKLKPNQIHLFESSRAFIWKLFFLYFLIHVTHSFLIISVLTYEKSHVCKPFDNSSSSNKVRQPKECAVALTVCQNETKNQVIIVFDWWKHQLARQQKRSCEKKNRQQSHQIREKANVLRFFFFFSKH